MPSAEIPNRLLVPKKHKRAAAIVAGVASLMGGYLLRTVFVAAEKPSADDPDLAWLAIEAKGGIQ